MQDIDLFKKKLGKRIAYLRDKGNFTQAELGALINKDYQSISRIENGRINASGFILKQIADALGVSMNEIFDI